MPFAEHLSFRIGNQIFFIFIIAAEYKFEGGYRNLFISAADDANAVPCLMPMQERLSGFEPELTGWGLIHADTGQPVDPSLLVTDELIEMSNWELRDFANQVVKASLESEGHRVYSTQSSLHIDPSIWFDEGGDACWVVVRAVRQPNLNAELPDNIAEIGASSSQEGIRGYFASVGVASTDDPFDPEAASNGNFLPLFRGHSMTVRYNGLKKVWGT